VKLNPTQVGNIAEAAIAAAAVRQGIGVLRPTTEGERYDLAFDLHPRLIRVQCKWALLKKGAVIVRSRTSRRGPGGTYIRETYSADEVDAIAAYCAELDRCYFVPIERIAGKAALSLRVSPAGNNQIGGIEWAKFYEFQSINWTQLNELGAIAQLGERRYGIPEVAGSSPASSTAGACNADNPTLVGAHEFRERFGWYMQRAVAGETIIVTRHGRPHLRLASAVGQTQMAA
jgi:prevent-host-death family protein